MGEIIVFPAGARPLAEAGVGLVPEDAFAKLIGRRATPEERERLLRVRDALHLREADAIWDVLLVFEHYDALYRQYPDKVAAAAAQTVEQSRAAFAAAAKREAAAVQQTLSEQVARTSLALARQMAARPIGIHRFSLAMALVVTFGALCVHVGYDFAARAPPFWAYPSARFGPKELAVRLFAVPAGWMIPALLIPLLVYGIKIGWDRAADREAVPRARAWGACVLGLCVVGFGACAALVAAIT